MRFGVKFGVDLPADPDELVQLAMRIEHLGFDSIWVGDHLVIPRHVDVALHRAQVGGVEFADKTHNDVLDPILALTYLSTVTTRIRLGLSVLVIPYRDPILTAKLLATLDVLSRGRLIVGAGVGWMKDEFMALGVPYEERGAIADEYLALMVELWTSESPTFSGTYRSIADVAFLPKPVQKPHPPIWIGGNGAPAMRRAARLGQGWMPNFQSPDELRPKLQQLRSMMCAGGRDESEMTIAVGCRLAADPSVAPSGSLLGGTRADITLAIEAYAALGVEELVLLSPREPNLDVRLAPLERFAEQVHAIEARD